MKPEIFEKELFDYLIYLVSKGYSQETIRWRKSPLKLFFGYLGRQNIPDLKKVTRCHIEKYRVFLKQVHRTPQDRPISEGTYRDHIIVLKDFFHWLVKAGKILVSPFRPEEKLRTHKASRLPQVLTYEEMIKVLESCPLHTVVGFRDRAILEILYSTGLRRSELVRLNVADFSFGTQELMIVNGKGRKDRVLPVGEYACHFTEAYLKLIRPWQVRSEAEKALFVTRSSGARLSLRTIAQIVERAVKRGGIEKRATPHSFRHTMATHMLRNKADLRHIQALLGHASIISTQIYTHMSLEDLKEVVRRAHPHGKRKE